MHIKYESQLREPLVYGNKDYHQVTEDILRPTLDGVGISPTSYGGLVSVTLVL